ncbi:multidrug efflux SMR transporter [Pseudoruegeria sp. SK021]|uniref:DMT family transporter n=1 Tax=Pseudoruegeria sp. SK021 TaxID=1933035 RepID=UPI000A24B3FE|nr:SMR family transporter [Pseudoruegeria sp. SK021]OSP55576.1 QacE family quaternary ammonium compound efflux SMR transporter [Pseudoruegeria sp. SK021]
MALPYFFLILAIASEVMGTVALQSTQQFTRLGPSIFVALSYALSFYFLSLTLNHIPVGVAYAIWSGVGIVSIAVIGYVVFAQTLDMPAILGMVMILCGVLVINLFSSSTVH